MSSRRFKWWHAAIIFIVANLLNAAPAGFNGEEAFYNNSKLPELAPPDWLFPPVWLFNNITSLIALYIVANLPKETPYRRAFINSEIAAWILFSIFSILYFGMKSPILAAIDTALGLGFAAASLYFGYRINRKAFWNIMPRFIWLLLATYVPFMLLWKIRMSSLVRVQVFETIWELYFNSSTYELVTSLFWVSHPDENGQLAVFEFTFPFAVARPDPKSNLNFRKAVTNLAYSCSYHKR